MSDKKTKRLKDRNKRQRPEQVLYCDIRAVLHSCDVSSKNWGGKVCWKLFLKFISFGDRWLPLRSPQLPFVLLDGWPWFALVTSPFLLPSLAFLQLATGWGRVQQVLSLQGLPLPWWPVPPYSLQWLFSYWQQVEAELNTGALSPCKGFPPRTVILLVSTLIIQSIAI